MIEIYFDGGSCLTLNVSIEEVEEALNEQLRMEGGNNGIRYIGAKEDNGTGYYLINADKIKFIKER